MKAGVRVCRAEFQATVLVSVVSVCGVNSGGLPANWDSSSYRKQKDVTPELTEERLSRNRT